jgi:hypothetical protein
MTRSIHFPPADGVPAAARKVAVKTNGVNAFRGATPQPAHRVNVIGCYADALRDVETAREKLRALLVADDRHGDLQVALSATRRLEANIQQLIEAEEER